MSLDKILDSIAAQLLVLEPALKTSKVAGGQFNLEEMRRHSVQLPGAFVTCVETIDAEKYEALVKTRGRFAVVLVERARPEGQPDPQDRPRNIARLAGRVVHKVTTKAKNWGNNEVLASPERVSSKNLYSKAADTNGIALWAITWDQMLLLKEDPPPGALDDFLELEADYQLVQDGDPTNPEIDATDIIKPNG